MANLFTSKLTKPIQAYNPQGSMASNMAGGVTPSAQNIAAAYRTPQAQLQMQQAQPQVQQREVTVNKPAIPDIDPTSPTSGLDLLTANVTTPEQEEKYRKSSLANQRILALGDALRQIGNIYHTTQGAPSQQLNNSVNEEYERYQKAKALRDRANQTYIAYQQQKAIQDQRMRSLEAETNYRNESVALRKSEHERLMKAQQLAQQKQDFYEKLKQEQLELDKAYKENKMTWDEYNAKSRRISAQASWIRAEKYVPGAGGGGGVGGYVTTTEEEYEPAYKNPITGKVEKWKKKTTRKRTANGHTQSSTETTTENAFGGTRHASGNGSTTSASGKKFNVRPAN